MSTNQAYVFVYQGDGNVVVGGALTAVQQCGRVWGLAHKIQWKGGSPNSSIPGVASEG
jgi:hypothetical protein